MTFKNRKGPDDVLQHLLILGAESCSMLRLGSLDLFMILMPYRYIM